MTTITKERIELFIKNPLDNGLTRGEQMELARIALASLEAEPIGFRCRRNDNLGDWSYVYHREPDDFERKHLVIEGIYAAPPAPVVPDERAAFNAWNNDENLPIAGVGAKNAAWLAWQARAELGRSLAVNSPGTPDSWISCSDRMPEDTKMLLAFSQGEIVAAYWNWVMSPIDYKKYRAFTYLSGNILDDVTHWMPLPEPPQEAK
ncbi:EaA-like protein [Escherichia phage vB_EcoP_ZX5]|nr:EaA-like protein [Escherichia phage vB_EcoP_ZX5]